jgi:predicted metal-dependent hydrolase
VSHLPFLDRRLQLVPQPGRVRAHIRGEHLLVPDGDHRAAVERLYRRLARSEIGERLDRAVASVGLSYSGLSIRNQRTRWASCSHSGAMSFNWRLLLAPERVLDYVIWHEICHLEVPDHSRRFWALLESRLPGFSEPHAWLRRHGGTLVL